MAILKIEVNRIVPITAYRIQRLRGMSAYESFESLSGSWLVHALKWRFVLGRIFVAGQTTTFSDNEGKRRG